MQKRSQYSLGAKKKGSVSVLPISGRSRGDYHPPEGSRNAREGRQLLVQAEPIRPQVHAVLTTIKVG